MASPMTRQYLVDLLSRSLGEDKAIATVYQAMADLSMASAVFEHDDGLRILQRIAETPGLVGITARCAVAKVVVRNNS